MTMYMVDELDRLEEEGLIRMYNEALVYAAYAEANSESVEEFEYWQDQADEAYYGMFRDDAEFAEELYNGIYNLKDMEDWGLYNYIDWDAVAGDLLMTDYYEQDGYYFRH